jgi:DNA-nicking Smr family endonuclease|tara:strand:- start:1409 stop:1828 length:420 start_codon:yes stop_codon:yes gene_type:complete
VIKKKDLPEEDKKIWEDYTKSPSDIYDKEKKNIVSNSRSERFKFDLHGFTLDEANQKVKEIILSCVKKKYKEILLITGKGLHSTTDNDTYVSKNLSKLKFSVPEFVNNNNELSDCVFSISEATIKDGGAGAILIKLKNL